MMTLITKKDIAELNEVQQENCISIFIPTHRAGKKVLNEEDTLVLKNQLKEVKEKLTKKGIQNDAIKKMTAPIQELIDDTGFWREQSDGLAIFIADDFYRKFTLPVYFKEFNYVSNSFYLKPLMPMFVGDGSFYLMTLELGDVTLHECTRHSFAEIVIDDLIPKNKQEIVGYDYEQKNLQSRTGGEAGAMFHGQEAATGKRKNEIKRYFRAINDGLEEIFKDKKIPLLIASQDYLFDIYNEVNSYGNLVQDNLKANLSDTNMFEIHDLAWENMAPHFDKKRRSDIQRFLDEEGTGKTSNGINQIVANSIHGKIETLFCENKEDIYGNYTNENGEITVSVSENPEESISLMNVAAINTFLQGGDVYLLEKEDMPDPNSRVNALYRY